eukprot:2293449-Rhodomonas_salina.2
MGWGALRCAGGLRQGVGDRAEVCAGAGAARELLHHAQRAYQGARGLPQGPGARPQQRWPAGSCARERGQRERGQAERGRWEGGRWGG